MEAQRQKRHYDRKAGVVELHPGDKVLVKLDAFRGQWQKLKNWWETPSIWWLNAWRAGYQHMRSRTTRIRKDKYSTEHDCFFGLPNPKVSRLG